MSGGDGREHQHPDKSAHTSIVVKGWSSLKQTRQRFVTEFENSKHDLRQDQAKEGEIMERGRLACTNSLSSPQLRFLFVWECVRV